MFNWVVNFCVELNETSFIKGSTAVDGFQKLSITKELLVLKNISL